MLLLGYYHNLFVDFIKTWCRRLLLEMCVVKVKTVKSTFVLWISTCPRVVRVQGFTQERWSRQSVELTSRDTVWRRGGRWRVYRVSSISLQARTALIHRWNKMQYAILYRITFLILVVSTVALPTPRHVGLSVLSTKPYSTLWNLFSWHQFPCLRDRYKYYSTIVSHHAYLNIASNIFRICIIVFFIMATSKLMSVKIYF